MSAQDGLAVHVMAAEVIVTARAMEVKGINNGTSGNVSARVDGGMLITPSGVPYDRLEPGDIIRMDFDTGWAPLRSDPGVLRSDDGVLRSDHGLLGSDDGVLGSDDGVLGSDDGVLGSDPGLLGSDPAPQSSAGPSSGSGAPTDPGRLEAAARRRLRPSSEWRFHLDILRSRPEVGAVVHAHPTSATALSAHGRGIGPFHYMVGVAGGHDIRCADYATFGTAELSENALRALEDRTACLLAHHGILAVGPDLPSALAVAVEVEVLAAQYLAALLIGEPPLLSSAQMDDVLLKMASPDGYGSSPE